MRNFIKKNWLYILLFCLILSLNILPRLEKKEELPEEETLESRIEEEPQSTFVDFEEAQKRSLKIEGILKNNLSLRLFYICANLSIVFIVLVGLSIDGYFLLSKFRKKSVINPTSRANPPPWTIGDVFKIIILAIILSYIFFIVFGFFLGFLESARGTKFEFYKNNNFRMIFDTIILDFIIFLVIMRFLKNVYGKKLTSLGFGKEKLGKNIFYGVCGYVGIIPVIFIIGILIYVLLNILKIKPPPQPIVGLFLAEKNVTFIFVSSAIAAILGPVIEEIFFRGVMYNAVKRKLGIFWGILITSVLFSFLHTHAMSYFLVGFIPITILGIVLAYLYEKTGSLIPSITLHVLNNVGSVIMVFLFKYFNNLTG